MTACAAWDGSHRQQRVAVAAGAMHLGRAGSGGTAQEARQRWVRQLVGNGHTPASRVPTSQSKLTAELPLQPSQRAVAVETHAPEACVPPCHAIVQWQYASAHINTAGLHSKANVHALRRLVRMGFVHNLKANGAGEKQHAVCCMLPCGMYAFRRVGARSTSAACGSSHALACRRGRRVQDPPIGPYQKLYVSCCRRSAARKRHPRHGRTRRQHQEVGFLAGCSTAHRQRATAAEPREKRGSGGAPQVHTTSASLTSWATIRREAEAGRPLMHPSQADGRPPPPPLRGTRAARRQP